MASTVYSLLLKKKTKTKTMVFTAKKLDYQIGGLTKIQKNTINNKWELIIRGINLNMLSRENSEVILSSRIYESSSFEKIMDKMVFVVVKGP